MIKKNVSLLRQELCKFLVQRTLIYTAECLSIMTSKALFLEWEKYFQLTHSRKLLERNSWYSHFVTAVFTNKQKFCSILTLVLNNAVLKSLVMQICKITSIVLEIILFFYINKIQFPVCLKISMNWLQDTESLKVNRHCQIHNLTNDMFSIRIVI